MRRTLISLAACVVATCASCTFAVGDVPVACSSDSDCEARGPDFAGTGCALAGPSKNTCVPRTTNSTSCSTNADCVEQTGPGSLCTTDAERVRCVPLLGADCQKTFGNPFVEGTAVVAIFGDFGAAGGHPGRDRGLFEAASQALAELRQSPVFSLRGGRSVALVGCDQGTPRATTARLAAAGITAIVGPTDVRAFRPIAEAAAAAGIPVVASTAFDDLAAADPATAGSVFRAGPTRVSSIQAAGVALAATEPALRKARGAAQLRIAAVFDADHRDFRDAVGQLIRFNGKAAVENAVDPNCGDCFATFDASDGAALAAFQPDVVLPWVSYGAASWAAALEASTKPPHYIVPLDTDSATDFGQSVLGGANQQSRFLGVRPSRSEADVAAFVARRAFPSGPAPSDLELRTYDATYLAAFALVAADAQRGDSPLRGRLAREAWPRVTATSGTPVVVGPLGIADGTSALARGVPIGLRGVLSRFQFLPSGAALSTWERVCLRSGGVAPSGAPWSDGAEPTFSDLCP